MPEIWCDGEKIGNWEGSSEPAIGDELPVTIDKEKCHAKVIRVFRRHNNYGAPTVVIEVQNPGPMPFLMV